MTAEVFIPTGLSGWWGGEDTRPRCREDNKVVFSDKAAAERSAQRIRDRGEVLMNAYLGKCGHWHVGHGRKKSY